MATKTTEPPAPQRQDSIARSLGLIRRRSSILKIPNITKQLVDDKHEWLLRPNDESEKKLELFNLSKDLKELKSEIFGSWLNILLLLVPFGFISYYLKWSETTIFFINFFGMIPLASILGDSTECLADHLGQTIGGLLNASFGNAIEIVVTIFALKRAKEYQKSDDTDHEDALLLVVQTSLIGSIFSNALLVLGCVFISNGLKYHESKFNIQSISPSVTLLMISSFVMILPSPYSSANDTNDELMVSRAAAIILMIMYICSLIFVLYTHRDLTNIESIITEEKPNQGVEMVVTSSHLTNIESIITEEKPNQGVEMVVTSSHLTNNENENENNDKLFDYDNNNNNDNDNNDDDNDDNDDLEMSLIGSMLLLFISTLLVAILSEYLVDTLEPMSESVGMSEAFVGIILLPIVGNAVEHITAVRLAYKNKMDIALSIPIGSAAQIAMFVVPLAVIIAWIMNLDLALDFETFEVQVFTYSTIIIFAIVIDGASNWLEGVMLISMYTLIGIAVWDQSFD